jgi:hypothetical protein
VRNIEEMDVVLGGVAAAIPVGKLLFIIKVQCNHDRCQGWCYCVALLMLNLCVSLLAL